MAVMTIVIKQTTHQLRTQAMLAAGLNPKAWYQQPAAKVERNRKACAKRGYTKHKGRSFD